MRAPIFRMLDAQHNQLRTAEPLFLTRGKIEQTCHRQTKMACNGEQLANARRTAQVLAGRHTVAHGDEHFGRKKIRETLVLGDGPRRGEMRMCLMKIRMRNLMCK